MKISLTVCRVASTTLRLLKNGTAYRQPTICCSIAAFARQRLSPGDHQHQYESIRANSSYASLQQTVSSKLVQMCDASTSFVDHLLRERRTLAALVADEAAFTRRTDKATVFLRLNYLQGVQAAHDELHKLVADLAEAAKMIAQLQHDTSSSSLHNDKSDINDAAEMQSLLAADIAEMEARLPALKARLVQLLIIDEQEDKENACVELSAGVGGVEARLFCGELFEMYAAFAARMGWSFEARKMDREASDALGGETLRHALVDVCGTDVFKYMKYESGVHRVQRVPKTEARGRIHTSTVGVVVTPRPRAISVELPARDLRIETKTSGGPGGQHANKTESAVRIHHLPSGIVVYSDAERVMTQNRSRALEDLRERLYQRAFEADLQRRQANRKLQIGSSGRSERIRTYNFLQDRVSDHRLTHNFTGIELFMSGDTLDQVIECLMREQQIEVLAELLADHRSNAKLSGGGGASINGSGSTSGKDAVVPEA